MPPAPHNFKRKQKVPKIDVERYLRRIKYEAPSHPTLGYLKKLHKHHLLSIPFENLDIHWHREIILDIDKIYNKVIVNKRGGFCYELNGLFYSLLLNLGFKCYLISARVFNEKGTQGSDYDHMALIVDIDNVKYLADVGFGELFLEPKKLTPDILQVDYTKYFKLLSLPNDEFILTSSADCSEFKKEYIFIDTIKQFIEFMPRCKWHQTSEESHFYQKKICSIATPDGRVSLTDIKLIETVKGKRTETLLLNSDDFNAKLRELFRIGHN
ncbi:MAG: arylamine N-acetyltransferase [Bacteroidetes bacterium]|nr:arylamine N-acetyltransferase [Bacteroidota bacterium]MDA1119003.1 arylamine N-acetyltransferase [Bacteroidota bacterium]